MFSNFYRKFLNGLNILRHPLLLIIRLYWGSLLIRTGFGKWTNIEHVGSYFASLHIPMPELTAKIVATIEILGGISLVLGLFSRVFAILIIGTLFGAYATAHIEALKQFFSNPSLFIAQEPFLYLYAALIVLCFGPGLFSFDDLIEKKLFGKAP